MKTTWILIRRDVKLFFKDKGMLFTSLVTPLILLVLYSTFLGNIYQDTFESILPPTLSIKKEVIRGLVGGQLISSLLAVSCVTVAFCSNMLIVQDKISGAGNDLAVSPVRPSALALSYYVSSAVATLIISVVAAAAGLSYLSAIGWFLSFVDVLLILLDVFLLVMFGTALSSCIHFFLSTQGQISAVGTIVSAGYGFLCGAYMPISQFADGLQKVLSFLPGTYGTSLLRNHTMRGAIAELEAQGVPTELIDVIRDTVDCNIYFFDHSVKQGIMYLYLAVAVLLLVLVYILMNMLKGKKTK